MPPLSQLFVSGRVLQRPARAVARKSPPWKQRKGRAWKQRKSRARKQRKRKNPRKKARISQKNIIFA